MRSIFKIALREWRYIRGNKRLLFIMCFIPTLYILLFGLLYSTYVVKDIRTAVLDYNNTALSRSVVEAFRDSEKFKIVGQVQTEDQLRTLMDNREITAALVIPEDLDSAVKKGQGSKILVIVNGTNMIFSNSVVTSASQIVSTLSAGINIETLEGAMSVLPDKALASAVPLSFRIRVWYNPTFNYLNFLLLGLAGTAIQQVVLLYMAVSLAREKETGTILELKDHSALSIVLGKLLIYFILNLISANIVLFIATQVFGVPFRGNVWVLEALLAVFLLAIMSLGVMLSTVCASELLATQIAMLVAVPSFLFSGFTWPLQAMPDAAKIISKVLPLTYFVNDLRDIALMGIPFSLVQHSITILGIMVVLFLPLAIFTFHRQLKKALKSKEEPTLSAPPYPPFYR